MTGDTPPLRALLDHLETARVLVIGDVVLDRFSYGEVSRISPEAPVPVLRLGRDAEMLGGAGNVVRNLVSLGAQAELVAVLGARDGQADTAGATVIALLEQLSVSASGLLLDEQRQTSVKIRYVSGAQQLLRVDRETVQPLSETLGRQLLQHATNALDACDLVVLSDYGKGVLSNHLAAQIIDLARHANRPVIVDPKERDFRHYRNASLITPNRLELAVASDHAIATPDQAITAARQLRESANIESALVTLGADGMALVMADGGEHLLPAEAREVFDVSGAGDTVVATVAAALATGASLRDAADLANLAAGVVVGKVGTAAVRRDDLEAALHHRGVHQGERKVQGRDSALETVSRWRIQGRRIGFTNGCFDLLHPGHVSLLRQARASCDRLVVAVNSDQSVRRLKGPERPIQDETSRASVLAALADVDLVVVFDEDTPLDLITTLRPDLLVKGADYLEETVVGAAEVKGWGGEIMLARLEEGLSTSATIGKLKR